MTPAFQHREFCCLQLPCYGWFGCYPSWPEMHLVLSTSALVLAWHLFLKCSGCTYLFLKCSGCTRGVYVCPPVRHIFELEICLKPVRGKSLYTILVKYTCMRILKAWAVSLDLRLFQHLSKGYVQPQHFTNKLHAKQLQKSTEKLRLRSKAVTQSSQLPCAVASSCRTYLTSLQYLVSMPAQIVTSPEPTCLIASACGATHCAWATLLLQHSKPESQSCHHVAISSLYSDRMLLVRYNGCLRVRATVLPLWCIQVICDAGRFSSQNVFYTRLGQTPWLAIWTARGNVSHMGTMAI